MSLIIEDGSIVANANSYVTVSGVNSYATAYGYSEWSDTAITDTIKEQAVLKAMRYIETLDFSGVKQEATQPLAFPRKELVDGDSYEVSTNFIPQKLINAVCEAAMLMLPDSEVNLQPVVTKQNYISAEKVQQIGVSYFSDVYNHSRDRSIIIEDMLREYLKNKIIVTIERC